MSSIVVEKAQTTSQKKTAVTASLAQDNRNDHKVTERKIRKYFLICESCFWCVSYCELYYDHDSASRSHNIITTQFACCPACRTDKIVESLPVLLDKLDKHSTGVNFN
jgi:hypothetical protein